MKLLYTSLFVIVVAACGQQHTKPTTLDQRVVLENDKVKVTEYTSMPGGDVCGAGTHSHPAHLNVLLTEAKVKVMLPDGKTLNQNAPAGTTFWSDAETHSVVNTGDGPIKAYIIETKHAPVPTPVP